LGYLFKFPLLLQLT